MIRSYEGSVLERVLREVLLDKVTLALEQRLELGKETNLNIWGWISPDLKFRGTSERPQGGNVPGVFKTMKLERERLMKYFWMKMWRTEVSSLGGSIIEFRDV